MNQASRPRPSKCGRPQAPAPSLPKAWRKTKRKTGQWRLSLLDRSDRGEARRRGTDLVRVQQTRALSRHGRDSTGRRQAPAIYLTELGPRRLATQLKWLVSTVIVAVSGLAIIGVVISTSMHVKDGSGMFGAIRRAGLEAMRPKGASTPGVEKPVSIGLKTDRLVVSSKGLTTKHLIQEQVVQRRGARD